MVLTPLGLALILAGQPIAWWARGTFFNSESALFPISIVLIGLLILVGLRLFKNPSTQSPHWLLAIYVLGYLVPISLLSLVDFVVLGVDAAYMIFTCIVLFTLFIIPLRELQGLAPAMVLVGGISSTLPLLELATGNIIESFTRIALKGNNNPLVLGMVGGATILSAIVTLHCSKRSSVLTGFFCASVAVAGAGVVVLSNTRSVMLSLIIVVPLFYFFLLGRVDRPMHHETGRRRQIVAFLAVLGVAAVLAPSAAVLLLGPDLLAQVSGAAFERAVGAISAITGSGFADQSSQARIGVFERTVDGLEPFGHGLNAQIRAQGRVTGGAIYPHLTYLQAFYDFGIVGAIWFALLHLVLPVVLISKRLGAGPLDPTTAFVILYYAYSHMDHLTHGTPYSWLALMPVGLVYVIVPRTLMRAKN